MADDTNSLMLHVKRVLYSSIRISYRSACDYPIVFGAGILLLFLHRSCPSLFAFLLSSCPVFLLTALLLGALLSYGEPNVPKIEEEVLKTQDISSLKAEPFVTDCCMKEEAENVMVETHIEKITKSVEIYDKERSFDGEMYGAHLKEETDALLVTKHEEDERYDTLLAAKLFVHVDNNILVERGAHDQEITEKVGLQVVESMKAESDSSAVGNQYQFGEFMSSCWQPLPRHDASESESDMAESSSSDASMTDIIPMLQELGPLLNSETAHLASTSKDKLSDDKDVENDDDDESSSKEDEDHDTEEDEGTDGKTDNAARVTWTEDNQKDLMDLNSSELEKNSKLESLLERRRAKNLLKFELDKSLMEMRAADAIRRMEEASHFRVQVPHISTPRPNPFDLSYGSEETIELPQIPDSAPSVLLPRRNMFDLPFDQLVDSSNCLQETWSPRSYYSASQRDVFFKRHENFDRAGFPQEKHSSRFNPCFVPGSGNRFKLGKGEISRISSHDTHSDSDMEQAQQNVKLFGSLEAHISEEMKILGAAISDAGRLEVNCGRDEGTQSTLDIRKSLSGTSANDDNLTNAGGGDINGIDLPESIREVCFSQAASSSIFSTDESESRSRNIGENDVDGVALSCGAEVDQPVSPQYSLEHPFEETNCELPVVEASSIEEINSLFKQLKEEMLMHSVSESPLGKPSLVKIEEVKSSELHVIEAGSIEEMNALFKEHNTEVKTHAGSEYTSDELPIVEHEFSSSELVSTDHEQAADNLNSELHVVEASSVEEIMPPCKQPHEAQRHSLSESTFGSTSTVNPEVLASKQLSTDPGHAACSSELHVLEASSVEDTNIAFKQLLDEAQMHSVSEPTVGKDIEQTPCSSEQRVVDVTSVEETNLLFKPLHLMPEEASVNIEVRPAVPSPASIEENSGLHILEASSVKEINSLFKQLHEEALKHALSDSTSGNLSTANLEVSPAELSSNLHVLDVSSVEELNLQFKKLHQEAHLEDRSSEPWLADNKDASHSSKLHVVEARSVEEINSLFKQLHEEAQKHVVLENTVGEQPARSAGIMSTKPLCVVTDTEAPAYTTELHVLEASSVKEINSVSAGDGHTLHSSELHVTKEMNKQLHEEAQMHAILESTLREPTEVELEARPNKPLSTDAEQSVHTSELHVREASLVEEMNLLFKQLHKEGHAMELQNQSHDSRTIEVGPGLKETDSEMLVLEAKSIRDETKISEDGKVELEPTEIHPELHVVEAKSLDDDHGRVELTVLEMQ